MIHIMRKNETAGDLASIYGIPQDEIIKKNSQNSVFAENCAVYIPNEKQIYFTETDCTPGILAEISDEDEDVILRENHCKKEDILSKDTRIYGRNAPFDKSCFAGIFIPRREGYDFTEADKSTRLFSALYVDCYRLQDEKLQLPADYPAINACRLNGTMPGIYISEAEAFSGENVMKQIKDDLRYKDYAEVLINTSSSSVSSKLMQLTGFFSDMGLRVSLSGNDLLLNQADHTLYHTLYYSPRKNIFDFGSFRNVISGLLGRIPHDKLGYRLKMGAADVDRKNMSITYPHISDLREIYDSAGENMGYDPDSKLCFIISSQNAHSFIHEDLRSIYAKAGFLREMNVSKFLAKSDDEGIVRCAYDGYAGI